MRAALLVRFEISSKTLGCFLKSIVRYGRYGRYGTIAQSINDDVIHIISYSCHDSSVGTNPPTGQDFMRQDSR